MFWFSECLQVEGSLWYGCKVNASTQVVSGWGIAISILVASGHEGSSPN